jgi:predicted nucleotidyltransferase
MRKHHTESIQKLTDYFRKDPTVLALLIGGSLVKGLAKEDSDVDCMLVVTDEEFERRAKTKEYQYFSHEFTDYEGGYVDGKFITLDFIKDASQKGTEPARWAFTNVEIAFSHIPELDELIRGIPVYQEEGHEERLKSFHSQVSLLRWFVGEAERHKNTYLMMHAVSKLVLFSGRLILAHNRILYPYHKWFLTVLKDAPEKPENLMNLIDELLSAPSLKQAEALMDAVLNFRDWGNPECSVVGRFIEDDEWNWRVGPAPLADR